MFWETITYVQTTFPRRSCRQPVAPRYAGRRSRHPHGAGAHELRDQHHELQPDGRSHADALGRIFLALILFVYGGVGDYILLDKYVYSDCNIALFRLK